MPIDVKDIWLVFRTSKSIKKKTCPIFYLLPGCYGTNSSFRPTDTKGLFL